jgi:hypothetical protein
MYGSGAAKNMRVHYLLTFENKNLWKSKFSMAGDLSERARNIARSMAQDVTSCTGAFKIDIL